MRRSLVPFVLAALLTAGGPGLNAPSHGSLMAQTGVDPCSLLDPAAIAPYLGQPVGAGVATGAGCRWRPAEGPGSVTIQIQQTRGVQVYAQQQSLLGVDEILSGLGDEAFRSGFAVVVRAGDRSLMFVLAPNIPGPRPREADVVALARAAVTRWLGA